MASSNRHWPSMFKSKPCNPHHQWQHDITSSLLSGCHRNPYTSGADERSPEPKPRWNPKPEQIRILEAIFNSGMVNPPRDEIRKIRAQLQEYGHVGEANVFYWFQNRKSRSKHKNRHLSKNQSSQPPKTTTKQPISATPTTTTASMITNPSSSSSSSDKSSPKLLSDKNPNNPTAFSLGSYSSNLLNQLAYSPNPASLNQSYDPHVQNDPFMFPWQQLNYPNQGFTGLFPDHHTQHQPMMMASDTNLFTIPHGVGPCTEFLLSELINGQHGGSDQKKDAEEEEKLMMIKLGFAPATSASIFNVMPPPSTLNQLQDQSSGSQAMKSTVFINDVAFEVNCGEFHIREAFGNDAVLLDSNGQPVLTDEWGITLQPLQHGASYYLI